MNHRMNRLALRGLVVLGVALLLSACGPSTPIVAPTSVPPTTPPTSIPPTTAPTEEPTTEEPTTEVVGDAIRGGLLYDKWWAVVEGAQEPTEDMPLWATQTTNTRSGADTWRCKECHGWDYLGVEGAYGSGSHSTGFPGVFGTDMALEEYIAALTGGVNPDHDFSSVMGEDDIAALAALLFESLIDERELIDYETKAPIGGDAAHGLELFAGTCAACHGEDGRVMNFGSEDEPEYVGTIALDNPWEFIHKVRFGQPDSPMPSAVASGWSIQDVIDVLTYAQTLPIAAP